MKPTQQLQDLGQSLWLDNITRDLLDSGSLKRYIDEWSITGLTSNPTIFDEAIGNTKAYDDAIRKNGRGGVSDEALFTELALQDLRRAADLFRPIFDATDGIDGWVSMEVSPLLANDTSATIEAAARIFQQADRPNLFVKIPGTPAGIPAIEESIWQGIPINVTLLFSRQQYLAAAEAYLRGIERRLAARRDPQVASVASIFVSRWDKAVIGVSPERLRNRLGIAIGGRTYRAYRQLLASARWQHLANEGARPQRLLWASTGTKDPNVSATLYVEALVSPATINTMPEKTLHAFSERGQIGALLDEGGGDAEAMLIQFELAGIDVDALAMKLQTDGAKSFVESWRKLMQRIAEKRAAVNPVTQSA